MQLTSTLFSIFILGLTLTTFAQSQALESAPFYGDPPDQHHPWAIHDTRRPQPPIITPGTASSAEQPGKPPSDAVILFDGTESSLANWESGKPDHQATKWIVKDGILQCMPGSGFIRTKKKFGDVQLHVEWAAPSEVKGNGQERGNSGIFLMGDFETQVLDNYNNPTYPDGTAGCIYGINPPMVNALRPPGQFQVVDIVFRRPLFKDGQQIDPGHATVFINGVVVQDATPFEGPGGHKARSKSREYPDTGYIRLQDHGNPVRYRNIWLRPLPTRAIINGSDGYLSTDATMAKRKETAATIRAEASAESAPLKKMKLTLESLVYELEPTTIQQGIAMITTYVDDIKALPADQLEAKKTEIKDLDKVFTYLVHHHILSELPAQAQLNALVKSKGWDKK